MIHRAVFIIFMCLETGTCQHFAGCRESYFLYNGKCLPCPDHCLTCISNTHCTKCTDNYYGVTCKHACLERDCECHKNYGYCTYGCPDGRFPEEGSANCPICPDNCELCSSSSDCVVCKANFYGKTCEKICSNDCERCNKTTGKCLKCEEGYYNEDGRCLGCPERCVGCYDGNSCSSCKAGYLELDAGQCIKLCKVNERDSFHRLNGQSESDALSKEGNQCGCNKDFKTRQPCIKYTSCPSTVPCLSCGTMMTYLCYHTCPRENDQSSFCESDCNVVDGTMYSLAFCLDTKAALSVNNITKTVECVADDETDVPVSVHTVFTVIVMMMVVVTVIYIIFLKRNSYIKKCQLAQTSDPEEHRMEPESGNIQPLLDVISDPQRESDTSKPVQQSTATSLRIDKEVQTDDQIAATEEVKDNVMNERMPSFKSVRVGNIPRVRIQHQSSSKAPIRSRHSIPGQLPYINPSSNRKVSDPVSRRFTQRY